MTKFISQVGQEKNKEQKQFDLFPWSRLHALYRLTLILYSKKKQNKKVTQVKIHFNIHMQQRILLLDKL